MWVRQLIQLVLDHNEKDTLFTFSGYKNGIHLDDDMIIEGNKGNNWTNLNKLPASVSNFILIRK